MVINSSYKERMKNGKINDVKTMSKPRTALFQGGEDDEPMAPQIITIGEATNDAVLKQAVGTMRASYVITYNLHLKKGVL